jgi:hypothetical protein
MSGRPEYGTRGLPLGPIGLLCVGGVLRNGFLCGLAIGLDAAFIDVFHAGLRFGTFTVPVTSRRWAAPGHR